MADALGRMGEKKTRSRSAGVSTRRAANADTTARNSRCGVTVRSRRAWPVTRPRSFTVGIANACFKMAPILLSSLRGNAASFAWLVSQPQA